MTLGTITATHAGSSSTAIRSHEPQFTPETIGERAKEVASQRFVQNPGTETRLHQFNTLKALLQHIRNIPPDAPSGLSIKNNALTVKLPEGGHQTLIDGFRYEPGDHGAIDALSALGLTLDEETRGSRIERFRCALSSVGNRLMGRDASHIRPERLALDRLTLENRVNMKLQRLPINAPSCNNILPHGDTYFFRRMGASNLEYFDLKGMPLHELDLRQADLSSKNLSGCSLPLDLTGVDLTETRLYGVTFGRHSPFHVHQASEHSGFKVVTKTYDDFEQSVERTYPDFSDVQLQGAKLTMPSPFESADQDINEILDRSYNHLNNERSGSLLKSIHSIGQSALKKKLMEDNIAHLIAKTTTQARVSINQPLIDILFNRDYLDPTSNQPNSHIRKLANELIEHHFATGDEQLLDLTSLPNIDTSLFLEEHIRRAEALLHSCSTNKRMKLEDAPAAFCQQLIQTCALAGDTVLRDRALTLQRNIFKLPANANSVDSWSEVLGYDDSDAVELGGIAVFPADEGASVVMTGGYYRTYIQSSAKNDDALKNPEVEIALLTRNKQGNIEQEDNSRPAEYIERNAFLRQFLTPAFTDIKMTSRLGLDLGPEYQKPFAEAGQTAVYRGEKLTSPEHKERLAAIVQPHLTDRSGATAPRDVAVTEAYVHRVLSSNRMHRSGRIEQGYLLLCVSAVFTKYSSSAQFGTEFDSPDALRALAAGLLASARERFPADAAADLSFEDLRNRLLGNGSAFTCTAEAYRKMNVMLRQLCQKKPQLKPIYEATIPSTWR